MSKYTTEVRFICENYAGYDESVGYNDVEHVIDSARSKIFDFTYPIFNNSYKKTLETKILKHYYTREIGFETVGLWKLKLNMKMNEIMPFYNKLYESELLEFDPFNDVHKTVTHQGTDSGTSSVDSEVVAETDAEDWNLFSDTPQGGVTGVDDETYLTNATKVTNDDTVTTTTDMDESHANENQWTEVVTGKQGTASYAKMLEELRNTFLNIDMMIIKDLAPLFMGIY